MRRFLITALLFTACMTVFASDDLSKQATAFYFYDENDMEPWNYAKKGIWYKLRLSAFLHKYKPIIVHWLRKIR